MLLAGKERDNFIRLLVQLHAMPEHNITSWASFPVVIDEEVPVRALHIHYFDCLELSTITYRIFEINCGFHVKWVTKGKV